MCPSRYLQGRGGHHSSSNSCSDLRTSSLCFWLATAKRLRSCMGEKVHHLSIFFIIWLFYLCFYDGKPQTMGSTEESHQDHLWIIWPLWNFESKVWNLIPGWLAVEGLDATKGSLLTLRKGQRWGRLNEEKMWKWSQPYFKSYKSNTSLNI